MICKKCNGKGYIYTNAFGTKGILRCDVCGGNGKILSNQQTNEEWLQSATTEELVKTILDLCDYRPCFACGIGYCDDEDWCHVYSDEAKEFVTEWLKQPHKEDDEQAI